MNLKEWVEYGWLRPEPTSPDEINSLLGIAERGLADAKVEAISTDLRFIAAFNAALSLATLALRATGHRTAAQAGHHVKDDRVTRTDAKARLENHSEIQDLQQQAEQIRLRRCWCRIGPGIAIHDRTRERTEKQHDCLAARNSRRALRKIKPWAHLR